MSEVKEDIVAKAVDSLEDVPVLGKLVKLVKISLAIGVIALFAWLIHTGKIDVKELMNVETLLTVAEELI